MALRARVAGVLVVIMCATLLAACPGDPQNKIPTSPGQPSVSSVEITGPASVAPGQTAQFSAMVHLSDGVSKLSTLATNVRWQSSNPSVLQVSGFGLATARQQRGDAILTADATVPAGTTRRGAREIVVVPDGTYRLVGVVSEGVFAVSGARVDVTPGSLSTVTNGDGQYRLYGVPPDATIRITADGYQPFVQSLQLAGHATQNFQLTLIGVRPDLTGNYTLAIDVTDGCPESPPLPANLQHRSYDAVLTQNGPSARVTLTEPRFKLNAGGHGNGFTGQINSSGVTFTLDTYSYYYYFSFSQTIYPNIAELLPDGTILVADGLAVTTLSSGSLSGTLSGELTHWDSKFPKDGNYLGGCFGSTLRFALTPR